jgi:protein-disulfide isomerase/uncharacterized membrane protein
LRIESGDVAAGPFCGAFVRSPVTTARRGILLGLLAIGLLLSAVLLLAHHGEGPAVSAIEKVCGGGNESGCHEVNTGPYSSLEGIPVAALGVFFYASLALLVALGLVADPEVAQVVGDRLGLGALALALAFDLYLLGVQAFRIHHYCSLCLATYVVNLCAIVLFPRGRKGGPKVWSRQASLLLAGWGFGSLALLAASVSSERALALRERIRAPLILSASQGSGDAEAKRLQAILDDPVKLDQYLNEKASRDFDTAPVVNLDLGGVPFRGPETAPIKVVDYSDFLCPYCRQAALGFSNWLPQSGGRVAFYYKNFPLDTNCNDRIRASAHPGACFVSLGGVCAQDQGKFWAYHDKVFSGPGLQNPTAQDVVRIATEAGLDGPAMGVCLGSADTKARLLAQIHVGSDAGVQATPTIFVNGRKLPRIDHFLEAIDKESRRLGLPPLPSPHP